MNRTEIIYDLICKHKEVDAGIQKANIQEAIFARGKSVNVTNDFSELLGKSHYSVADIWGHEKKFVLFDLCKIAEYLDVNIYTLLHPFKTYTKEEFIRVDRENRAIEDRAMAGSLYMKAENLRKNHRKENFVWNIRNFLKQPEDNMNDRQTFLRLAIPAREFAMKVCGAELATASSWMTVSKKPAPMPDICKMALKMNVDVIDLMSKKIGE